MECLCGEFVQIVAPWRPCDADGFARAKRCRPFATRRLHDSDELAHRTEPEEQTL